ncbi:MAG: tRNA uridine(34) 5-carboxymethylaminomethyl modification radical SAM/GNAT enzyme Elp3 [Candidatus Micrarchaeota archaeon]|nr:tRNA uridine(34) 5-carboxymethylaminomethyl modification radical SAM/GNAT enzyme Elp3 [Candidatus Micrarchaeota archaeon]
MQNRKVSAENATLASIIQKATGRLPPFKAKVRKPDAHESAIRQAAAKEAAAMLQQQGAENLNSIKLAICGKYRIAFLKNSEILAHVPASSQSLRAFLLKSPTRTLSGVSPIAIMPPPSPCGGSCTYCPKGENAPQSYTGYEPTTMRAIQNGYSASRQIQARLNQYAQQGHLAEKCHLIIMGGTFLYGKPQQRSRFMKEAFEALNKAKSPNLKHAVDSNEHAPHKAIGVTFETRPDYGLQYHADEMLRMGGTQVELGVQSLSDRVYKLVRRGHAVSDVACSSAILRNCGFKILYHMMPGLFSTPAQDISYFKRLFSESRFRPDMLKIYPALVLQGTALYAQWKRGEFSPYDTQQAAEVIAQAIKHVPPYVRISRIQRDIPSPLVCAGVKNSNLRQIVEQKLAERGERCRCIRCREIGSQKRLGREAQKLSLSLQRIDYEASFGKEVFLSFEDEEQGLLAAFLRLRMPNQSHRKEIDAASPSPSAYRFQSLPAPQRPRIEAPSHTPQVSSSIVRELHVYGQEASIGERAEGKMQHKGLGRRLLAEAEEITKKEFGLDRISVLSGPGARGYYRKLGYSLRGAYMSKKI